MNTKVIVRVTGRIARTVMPATRRVMIDDDRHQPFPNAIGNRPIVPVQTTNVMMSKWQAIPEFFSQIKFFYNQNGQGVQERLWMQATNADEYVYLVNVWLTIVNYFGLEVQYRKEFVEQVKELTLLIPAMAFRKNGTGQGDHVCRFHGQDYTYKEMRAMFDAFFKSYGVM